MEVFIARDGAVIAELPHQELEKRAQAGELLPTDHYWHDGMTEWLPLSEFLRADAWDEEKPPEPPPPPLPLAALAKRALIAAAVCVAFAFVGWLLIHFTNSNSAEADQTAARSLQAAVPAPLGAEAELQIREKASAELRQKIETLPARPEPPLNTFYYDVSVHMKKTFSARTPWTATIRGGENMVEAGTENTLRRTAFVLLIDYTDGAWLYKGYRASTTNLADFTTMEVEEAADTLTPPSLVGLLGLRTPAR